MPPHTKSAVLSSSSSSPETTKVSTDETFHPRIISNSSSSSDKNNNDVTDTKEDYYEPIPLIRSTAIPEKFEPHIRWPDLMAQLFLHVGFLYGLYFLVTGQAQVMTYVWGNYHYLFFIFSTKNYDFNSFYTCLWFGIRNYCRSSSTLVKKLQFSI